MIFCNTTKILCLDGTSHLTLVEAFQRLRHLYPEFTEKDLENEIMTFLVTVCNFDTLKSLSFLPIHT